MTHYEPGTYPDLEKESVTRLLRRWSSGDAKAFDELMGEVYGELHGIAGQCFRRERSEHTLQATALLHEAVLRLMDLDGLDWKDRAHFYAVTARMMRRILVDHTRQRRRLKRGDGDERVTLSEAEPLAVNGRNPDVEVLDAALVKLEARDPQKARIVELRFFTGLTGEEIACCLDVSVPTVTREWRRARTWLYSEIKGRTWMDDLRWQQIDRLFEEALEVEEERRDSFLRRRCGDDKLRCAVERLLALEVEAGSFLAEPIGAGAAEDSRESSKLDGLRVGPYRLLRSPTPWRCSSSTATARVKPWPWCVWARGEAEELARMRSEAF